MKKFLMAEVLLVLTVVCLMLFLTEGMGSPESTRPSQTIPTTVPTATAPTSRPSSIPTLPSTAAPTIPTLPETEASVPTAPSTQPVARPQAGLAFVYDPNADWLLYQKGDPRALVYPASLTKIFTAYVALQLLEPEAVVTVGQELKLIHPESSLAGLRPGNRLSVRMLIQGMLLPSGNDAAYALAAAAGYALSENRAIAPQAAVSLFMAEVNRVAQMLGLTGTHFSNPDGIHRPDHYTTAYDLLQMAALAMEEPVIAEICAQPTATVTFESGQTHTWENTNALVRPDSPYYIPGCMGLKTGYESAAGFCLLSVFPCEGSYRFALVLQSPTLDDRFADSVWLYEQFLKD